jgi:hypothetical protein
MPTRDGDGGLSPEERYRLDEQNHMVAMFAFWNAVAAFGLVVGADLTGGLFWTLAIPAAFGLWQVFNGIILFSRGPGCTASLVIVSSTSLLTLSSIWLYLAPSRIGLAFGMTAAALLLVFPMFTLLTRLSPSSFRAARRLDAVLVRAVDAASRFLPAALQAISGAFRGRQ